MAQGTYSVTDQNFETDVINSAVPVLVDFWAPWCGPCLSIGPVLEQLATEYQGKIKIVKMNVDENAQTPSTFGVRSIPYLAMIKNGKVVDSVLGAVPKAKLVALIDKSLV